MHVLSKDVWASQPVNENEKINFSPSGTIPTALLIFKAQKFTGVKIQKVRRVSWLNSDKRLENSKQ